MRKVLELNADFTPIKMISWKQAMTQILTEEKTGAYVVEYYDDWEVLGGRNIKYKVPAIIALKKYVDEVDNEAPYTKGNVYNRDGMTCQYCGVRFKYGNLTIDHVIPRSKWHIIGNGKRVSSFENTVAACNECNRKKSNMTCTECNMFPINKPVSITVRKNFYNRLSVMDGKIPAQWKPYLKGITSEQEK